MDPMICRGSAPDKGPFRTVQCVKFATVAGSTECRKQADSAAEVWRDDLDERRILIDARQPRRAR